MARIEFQRRHFLAAAEQRAEQGERLRDGFREGVDDYLDDNAADGELGIVERSGNRQIEIDHAVPVLQQRHREPYRQRGGIGAVDLVTESELVEDQPVLRAELAVFDLVGNFKGQLALVDAISRIPARVW